jgi:hypothetical protein
MKTHRYSLDEATRPRAARTRYRIDMLGGFEARWLDMLSGDWTIVAQPVAASGATILMGEVIDQAALMGTINQLYDMGLPLLLVQCLAYSGSNIAIP